MLDTPCDFLSWPPHSQNPWQPLQEDNPHLVSDEANEDDDDDDDGDDDGQEVDDDYDGDDDELCRVAVQKDMEYR